MDPLDLSDATGEVDVRFVTLPCLLPTNGIARLEHLHSGEDDPTLTIVTMLSGSQYVCQGTVEELRQRIQAADATWVETYGEES